ncbi:hypothetical protein [Candidatus Poriferisodalis sp.]|uniref:hypothetical protein n=1 Tax=Candidatus Poriferisodalis sp. TaxID=3101277 RepID=UPI003B59678E
MEPKDRLPIGISLLALAVAIAALVVAVSDSDSDDAVDESETSVTASAPATTQAIQTTTTVGTVQTLAPAPATTAATQLVVTATTAAESDEMADSEFSDNVLAVVGIGHDSTLNVRETPGGQIVGKLGSDAAAIVPTGTTRELTGAIWYEVHAAGVVGWVSGAYVTPLGVTVDATTEIVAVLGETPSADNMTALGRTVAGAMASEEPESRVRISGAPTVGDVGEITMDVVGQPDDSVRGFRLKVFATPNSDGTFTLRNVEGTVMCYIDRGVGAQGLCN